MSSNNIAQFIDSPRTLAEYEKSALAASQVIYKGLPPSPSLDGIDREKLAANRAATTSLEGEGEGGDRRGEDIRKEETREQLQLHQAADQFGDFFAATEDEEAGVYNDDEESEGEEEDDDDSEDDSEDGLYAAPN
jgi:hypothetical protein